MFMAAIAMFAQVETTFREPGYFAPVMLGMLVLGAIAWLIAAVLGFARARAFGPSARWFSFAAVCLILFHLQFIVLRQTSGEEILDSFALNAVKLGQMYPPLPDAMQRDVLPIVGIFVYTLRGPLSVLQSLQ